MQYLFWTTISQIFSQMRLTYIFSCFALSILLANCSGKCTYKVFAKVPNPRKNYNVVQFFNWCGYTCSNNNNFSLLRATDRRIIFIANSKVRDELDRDNTIKISWISDSSLLIKYDSTLIIFEKKLKMDNVAINYGLR
jgi:hypothetical protein